MPKSEVAIRRQPIEPPDDLPEEARAYWDEFVTRLDDAGILDRVDLPAATMMCTCYALFERARTDVEEFGLYALGSMGQVVVAPSVSILQTNAQLYLRFAEHFAVTPASRARLGLDATKARKMDAEMEALLGPNNRKVD